MDTKTVGGVTGEATKRMMAIKHQTILTTIRVIHGTKSFRFSIGEKIIIINTIKFILVDLSLF